MMKLLKCRRRLYLLAMVTLLFVVSCGREGAVLPPVEEEQIKNVALDFFVRDAAVPAYEVTIEAVVDDWARVALSPVATDSSDTPIIMYLQNQATGDHLAPTAVPMALPGNTASTETALGWVVITPPQAQFTTEELNTLAIPAKIRS